MTLNIEQLIVLADHLDKEGKYDEVNKLDEIVKKLSVSAVKKPLSDEERQQLEERIEKSKEQAEHMSGDMFSQLQAIEEERGLDWSNKKDPEPKIRKILEDMHQAGWLVFSDQAELDLWNRASGTGTPAGPKLETAEDVDRFLAELGIKSSINELPGVKKISSDEELDLPVYQPEMSSREEQQELVPGAQEASMPILETFKSFLGDPQENYDNLIKLVEDYHKKSKIPEQIETEEEAMRHREELEAKTSEELGKIQLASRIEVFEKLADISDRLDKLGASEEASLVDGFIKSHADEVLDYQGEDEKGEQSKRYDSKYHRSLQVRKPKTDIDREGRDKHHIDTMQSVEFSALSTRYCPEHIGVTVGRIGELTYQCPLDGAVYNWETGWVGHEGKEYPGGSVAAQTPYSSNHAIPHRVFDSRESVLNRVN